MIDKQELERVRESHANVSRQQRDRQAVIVRTEYAPGKWTMGVQFWTHAMITIGESVNTDRTVSRFVATL